MTSNMEPKILTRKEIRKKQREAKKQKKRIFFSKNKETRKREENEKKKNNGIVKSKNEITKKNKIEKTVGGKKVKKDLKKQKAVPQTNIKKDVINEKKNTNKLTGGKNVDARNKKKVAEPNNVKKDKMYQRFLEEQKKDDMLIAYLEKKLKLKGSRKEKEEKKIWKELELDGIDSGLIEIADNIIKDLRKESKEKTTSSDRRYHSTVEKQMEEEEEEEEEEEDEEEEEEDQDDEDEDEDALKKSAKHYIEKEAIPESLMKKKSIKKTKSTTKKKSVVMKSSNEEQLKNIEKYITLTLNKISEFNIKSIIEELVQYFFEINDTDLRISFRKSLIKAASEYFTNIHTTEIHICIHVIVICVLNSMIYKDLMKEFLINLTNMLRQYYNENVKLIKMIEEEIEMNNNMEIAAFINNIEMETVKEIGTEIDTKIDTEMGKEKGKELSKGRKREKKHEINKEKGNTSKKKNYISEEQYEQYDHFKIRMRNILKCFSLFYALDYLDFEFLIDVINMLCEKISINNVDNVIIILKICGNRLKKNDTSHLNFISEFLKNKIKEYVLENTINLEKSKFRFLIKDIEDLQNGKMKFYFLDKCAFLFDILSELQKKYNFKKQVVYLSFADLFKGRLSKIENEKGKTKEKEKEKEKERKRKNKEEGQCSEQNDPEIDGIGNNTGPIKILDNFINEPHFIELINKYNIQGIIPKKMFLIIKNSLDIHECTHNLTPLLKKKKYISFAIQTIIQMLIYEKTFKEVYLKLLNNISAFRNRIFLFSLKTIFINYLKNINNYKLKQVLYLSKLFVYLVKQKLLDFVIFKFLDIDEHTKLTDHYKLVFFFKTIFVLLSLGTTEDEENKENQDNDEKHDQEGQLVKSSNITNSVVDIWAQVLELVENKTFDISVIYFWKKIIKKYIFDELQNVVQIYPNFHVKCVKVFYSLCEKAL